MATLKMSSPCTIIVSGETIGVSGKIDMDYTPPEIAGNGFVGLETGCLSTSGTLGTLTITDLDAMPTWVVRKFRLWVWLYRIVGRVFWGKGFAPRIQIQSNTDETEGGQSAT